MKKCEGNIYTASREPEAATIDRGYLAPLRHIVYGDVDICMMSLSYGIFLLSMSR
jgi:hypothetical protein